MVDRLLGGSRGDRYAGLGQFQFPTQHEAINVLGLMLFLLFGMSCL